VIGASKDREKYSNKAVRAYLSEGFEVFPVNPKETEIEGLACYRRVSEIPGSIDIALFYVNPEIGLSVIEQVAQRNIRTVYLNPGADSEELAAKAASLGIEAVRGCAIRAIGIDPADL
jgi:hypothetical protein